MRNLINQFIKFAGVGTAAFFIDYGLMIFFTEVFGIYYLVSATMSFTISMIFNYVASMRFVFMHRKDISRTREFMIFVILSVLGLCLNNIGMFLGVEVLRIDYRITKILATMCVTVFNFFTRRIFLDGSRRESQAQGQ
ncbi:MAG: GtrA family protein [Eggerthellaceae bacterium]|nr:GtrA family protein [Eggerthellaceae bacterium]